MKRSSVSSIEYGGVYEYIIASKCAIDFIERMKVICVAIVHELSRRIDRANPHFPLQTIPLVENLDDEINFFLNTINKCHIVEGQKTIHPHLLFRLLKLYHPKILTDYNLAKNALLN